MRLVLFSLLWLLFAMSIALAQNWGTSTNGWLPANDSSWQAMHPSSNQMLQHKVARPSPTATRTPKVRRPTK